MVESRTQEIKREVISLRDHLEELRKSDLDYINRRFIDAEKAVLAALATADKAVEKAEKASEKRADASNEIRQAMVDQQATFITKPEHTGLERRISLLEEATSRSVGRMIGTTSSSELAFRVIAAIGVIAGVGGVLYGLAK